MSRAGAAASKVERLAKKWDAWQARIESEAFLDVVVAICDGCHKPVATTRDTPCVCGSMFGTFDSYPTIPTCTVVDS